MWWKKISWAYEIAREQVGSRSIDLNKYAETLSESILQEMTTSDKERQEARNESLSFVSLWWGAWCRRFAVNTYFYWIFGLDENILNANHLISSVRSPASFLRINGRQCPSSLQSTTQSVSWAPYSGQSSRRRLGALRQEFWGDFWSWCGPSTRDLREITSRPPHGAFSPWHVWIYRVEIGRGELYTCESVDDASLPSTSHGATVSFDLPGDLQLLLVGNRVLRREVLEALFFFVGCSFLSLNLKLIHVLCPGNQS